MENVPGGMTKDEGLRLLKEGNIDEAIDLLEKAKDEDPEDAQIHSYLGAAYNQKGDKVRSIFSFEEALRLEETPRNYFNLGLAYQSVNRTDEAIRQYNMALDIDPDYKQARTAVDRLKEAFTAEHSVPEEPEEQIKAAEEATDESETPVEETATTLEDSPEPAQPMGPGGIFGPPEPEDLSDAQPDTNEPETASDEEEDLVKPEEPAVSEGPEDIFGPPSLFEETSEEATTDIDEPVEVAEDTQTAETAEPVESEDLIKPEEPAMAAGPDDIFGPPSLGDEPETPLETEPEEELTPVEEPEPASAEEDLPQNDSEEEPLAPAEPADINDLFSTVEPETTTEEPEAEESSETDESSAQMDAVQPESLAETDVDGVGQLEQEEELPAAEPADLGDILTPSGDEPAEEPLAVESDGDTDNEVSASEEEPTLAAGLGDLFADEEEVRPPMGDEPVDAEDETSEAEETDQTDLQDTSDTQVEESPALDETDTPEPIEIIDEEEPPDNIFDGSGQSDSEPENIFSDAREEEDVEIPPPAVEDDELNMPHADASEAADVSADDLIDAPEPFESGETEEETGEDPQDEGPDMAEAVSESFVESPDAVLSDEEIEEVTVSEDEVFGEPISRPSASGDQPVFEEKHAMDVGEIKTRRKSFMLSGLVYGVIIGAVMVCMILVGSHVVMSTLPDFIKAPLDMALQMLMYAGIGAVYGGVIGLWVGFTCGGDGAGMQAGALIGLLMGVALGFVWQAGVLTIVGIAVICALFSGLFGMLIGRIVDISIAK